MSSEAPDGYFDWLASHRCVACGAFDVEIHHISGAIDLRTGIRLPKRRGDAYLCVLPLCPRCHRHDLNSVENIGQHAFARRYLGGDEGAIAYAMTYLARYVILHDSFARNERAAV